MIVKPATGPLADWDADFIVVGQYEGDALSPATTAADALLHGALARLWQSREITGKHGELFLQAAPPGQRASLVLVVGLGKQADISRGAALRAAGAAAKYLARKQRSRVAMWLDEHWPADRHEAALCGAMIGCQGQDLFRAERKLSPFDELLYFGADADTLHSGQELGDSVNLVRHLVNQPPNMMYPTAFAETAETVCRQAGITVEVWDEKRLEQEKCGALLAVSQGSARPPRLLIMRYAGGPSQQPPLALVGKGVTFDSGGYSIKPTDGMKTMKCDMAGAATVLGAMRSIARQQLPVNVIGLVGLVENLVSGTAFKLGDVLTARSGKTIEVLNTDAEGRLVLADVLDVACQHQPGAMIDLATLTGACVVALGTQVAGLMTNHNAWCQRVFEAAGRCGEAVWQLPMFPEYAEHIRSCVADIKNTGEGRYGGAISAAKFLEEFVRNVPWTHIDIAGPAFFDSSKSWIDAGGSGAMVRTLVELARTWNGQPAAPTETTVMGPPET